ncbi:MAG: patatin-like phospholipase family protein [Candidatus Obscuribacterales bacterium]|nr:patatin-like phospholipase family protein [Candidatus Obscuribacterales bacterium]
MSGNGKDESSYERPVSPKRALVMPGGGGRGAYQVGVAKALMESGLQFDMAFGTSIGAINAAFLAQGDFRRLEEIWGKLCQWDIYKLPSAHQIGRMMLGHKLGMLDTKPLEELLRREADLRKIKAGPMKVRLFTTDLCSLETRLIKLEDLQTSSELVDVLMATSAVPIAFPPRHLNGKGLWVDGGLVRNTPLRAAIDQGAEEIFMVLLHPETVNICPSNMWQVIARLLDIVLDSSAQKELELARLYNRLIDEGSTVVPYGMRSVKIEVIQPRRPVDINLLEIDPERSKELIKLGYEDANLHLQSMYEGELRAAKAS